MISLTDWSVLQVTGERDFCSKSVSISLTIARSSVYRLLLPPRNSEPDHCNLNFVSFAELVEQFYRREVHADFQTAYEQRSLLFLCVWFAYNGSWSEYNVRLHWDCDATEGERANFSDVLEIRKFLETDDQTGKT